MASGIVLQGTLNYYKHLDQFSREKHHTYSLGQQGPWLNRNEGSGRIFSLSFPDLSPRTEDTGV